MTAAKSADPVPSIYTTSPAMQRRNAAETRWKAAIAARVDLIATDHYEQLAPLLPISR